MYAHVTTHHLGTYAATIEERDVALADHCHGRLLSDQAARTIASWYHSPGECCTQVTALSHGMPFDTDGLRTQIHYEIYPIDSRDAEALTAWLDHLEALLADG